MLHGIAGLSRRPEPGDLFINGLSDNGYHLYIKVDRFRPSPVEIYGGLVLGAASMLIAYFFA